MDIENIAPGNLGRLGLVRFGMRPRRRVVSRRIDVVSLFADISRVNSYFEPLRCGFFGSTLRSRLRETSFPQLSQTHVIRFELFELSSTFSKHEQARLDQRE